MVSRVLLTGEKFPRRWLFIWGEGYPSPQAAYPGALGGAPVKRPLWPCSRRGLPCHSLLPGSAVGSYPTFSPLPAPEAEHLALPLAAGGLFSVALSRGYPLRVLPGALPCGARTFLPGCLFPGATTSKPCLILILINFSCVFNLFLIFLFNSFCFSV